MNYEKAKVPFRFAEELSNFFGVVLDESRAIQLTKRLSAWRDEHVAVEFGWLEDVLLQIREHATDGLRGIGIRKSDEGKKL